MKNKCENERGQTMVEVLVALTLLVLFLSGVIVIELYSLRNIEFSQTKSMASSLARQQLERARVIRDTTGLSGLGNCTSVNPCYLNSDLVLQFGVTPTGTYSQTLYLSGAEASECSLPVITITPEPTIYKITAVVRWDRRVNITPAPEIRLDTCLTDWR